MAVITQIQMPSGTTYDIQDQGARDLIAAINNWSYVVCTSAADTPKDVTWTSGSTTITGTLVASSSTMYKIYLVPSTNGTNDVYDEYITINPSGSTYKWEMFGNTKLPDMNDYLKNKSGHSGETAGDYAYANSASLSFGTHTTATVLKSNVTATVPKPSGTTKYLKLTPTTDTAITSLGDASTDTFVKSYPGATSKLTTTTVTGVQSSTTTASKATAGTAVAVAKTGTAVAAVTGVNSTGTSPTTAASNTVLWAATVDGTTLKLEYKPLATSNITPAVSNGSITPYTFSDVTVPIKNTSATTVATGGVAAGSSGATVMTGLGTATTASAVTGYASPSSASFLTGVTASTTSTSTDGPGVITAVSTSGTNSVTFATSGHTAAAITALGTPTITPST